MFESQGQLCGDFLELAADHAKKQLQRGKERSTKVGSGGGGVGYAGLFTLISKATRGTFLHRKFQFSAS